MASGPITSWQIEGKNGNGDRLDFLGLQKSLWMVSAAMKLKDAYSWEEKLLQISIIKAETSLCQQRSI